MKQKWISRALSLALVAAFVPSVAMAETYYIENGDITVRAEADGSQYVSQGTNNTDKPETLGTIITSNSGGTTQNTVTIESKQGATADVTLENVSIDVSGKATAAVSTAGDGDVTIELNGNNTLKSGVDHAGLEKNNDGNLTIQDKDGNGRLEAVGGNYAAGIGGGYDSNGSDITITGGRVEARGGESAAGIGGGKYGVGSDIKITGNAQISANGGAGGAGIGGGGFGSGSDISISGNARVEAKSNLWGAGIGGGGFGSGSDITVSDEANVKVSGGKKAPYDEDSPGSPILGAGAGIGNGGQDEGKPGNEIDPDISNLYTTGKIEYYEPGSNFDPSKLIRTLTGTKEPPVASTAEPTEAPVPALYRVTDSTGNPIAYTAARKDGVLTLTVTADTAILTGTLSGLRTLVDEGVTQITLTNGAISAAFSPADLLAKGTLGDTYALTLQENPTLTLNGETVEL